MKSETFIRVAQLSELNGDGPFALSANEADIVLVKSRDNWRAFEGRCPHQGALLGEGELDGGALVCRNHRWRFSVGSGQREGGPECLASCPVAERDGGVFVDVTGLKKRSAANAATRSLDDLPGPNGWPLVGNMHQLDATKVHLVLEEWAGRYGSIYQFRMGSKRVVATTDPALIEQTLERDPRFSAAAQRWTSSCRRSGSEGCSTRRARHGARSASSRWRLSHSATSVSSMA